MSCLATVTADVWFDATGPAPAGLCRYFCRGDGSEVNSLGEGLVWGLGFIGVVKRFLFKRGHSYKLLLNKFRKVVIQLLGFDLGCRASLAQGIERANNRVGKLGAYCELFPTQHFLIRLKDQYYVK